MCDFLKNQSTEPIAFPCKIRASYDHPQLILDFQGQLCCHKCTNLHLLTIAACTLLHCNQVANSIPFHLNKPPIPAPLRQMKSVPHRPPPPLPPPYLGRWTASHHKRAICLLGKYHHIAHNHAELPVQLSCSFQQVHAALVVDPEPGVCVCVCVCVCVISVLHCLIQPDVALTPLWSWGIVRLGCWGPTKP